MFTLNLTDVRITRPPRGGADKTDLFSNTDWQFCCKYQDLQFPFASSRDEDGLSPPIIRLRSYSIVVYAIQLEKLQGQEAVSFELTEDLDGCPCVFSVSIPVTTLLFGPSGFEMNFLNSCGEKSSSTISFKNSSCRVLDYSIVIKSIRVTGMPSSHYSFYFSSGVIDSVSCQPYEPCNDMLDFPVGLTQHILYSRLSDMKLQLFDSAHNITTFRLPSSVLHSCVLSSTSRFQMSGDLESQQAFIELKVVKSQCVSCCSQSDQRYAHDTLQSTLSSLHCTPIIIEESSLVMPHSPISLSNDTSKLNVLKGDTKLLQIPLKDIAVVTVHDDRIGDKEEGGCRVALWFAYRSAYLHKMVFTMSKDVEWYHVFQALSQTPQTHNTRQYERKIDDAWIELSMNDKRAYLNTNSGHYVDVIPSVTEIKRCFRNLREIRWLELMYRDDRIVVKSVRDKGISRDIGSGYVLKSILIHGEKRPLTVQSSNVTKAISLLQHASSYPLETTFVNPILQQYSHVCFIT